MIIIAPSHVTFDGKRIDDVEAVAIENVAEQLVVEYSDASRDPAFADVARRRTTIKVVCLLRRSSGASPADPAPGTLAALTFGTGATQVATASSAMVVGVSYQFASLPKGAAARRTIEFILVSPTGSPVLSTTTIGGAP